MSEYLPAPKLENDLAAHHAAIRARTADCRVCLGQHDDEIHEATLSVRRWFRDEVTKSFQPIPLM